MGIDSIAIVVNNIRRNQEVIYAGTTIEGYCQVDVSEEITALPGVMLRFQGLAWSHWSEDSGVGMGRHTIYRFARHDIIDIKQELTVPTGSLLTPGIHEIPFEFQTPSTLITSYEGLHGYIRYWLKVKVPKDVAVKEKVKTKQVKILQPIDVSIPQYSFPVCGTDCKKLCCCCCAEGPIQIEAHTDRAAFGPNEVVSITADFQNKSNRSVKPYANLVQTITHMTPQGKRKINHHSWPLTIVGQDVGQLGEIPEGRSAMWNKQQFTVPQVLPSISCPVLRVDYYIEVRLDVPASIDLGVFLPIVIGTIPYHGVPPIVTTQIRATRLAPRGSIFANLPATPWEGSGSLFGAPPAYAAPIDVPGADHKPIGYPPECFNGILSEPPQLPRKDHEILKTSTD